MQFLTVYVNGGKMLAVWSAVCVPCVAGELCDNAALNPFIRV